MTRDELLFSICTINRVYDCCIADDDYDCDKCKRLTKEWHKAGTIAKEVGYIKDCVFEELKEQT